MAYKEMNGAGVRALKDEEIEVSLKDLRDKLFVLKNQSVSEKIEDNSQFGKIRRDVARLMTEQTTRQSV